MDEKKTESRPIDNEAKFQDLKTKFDKIFKEKLNSSDEEYNSFRRRIIEKVHDLQSKYPDSGQYLMAYVIAQGTPPNSCSKFDFPGDDSIEKFIEELEKEEK
jgi:hypothetical protein